MLRAVLTINAIGRASSPLCSSRWRRERRADLQREMLVEVKPYTAITFNSAGATLQGKRGPVVRIANEHSIATGRAEAFAAAGARLATTYLNDKAKPFVRAAADRLGCNLLLPCDVRIGGNWRRHSTTFARRGPGQISCCTRLPSRCGRSTGPRGRLFRKGLRDELINRAGERRVG